MKKIIGIISAFIVILLIAVGGFYLWNRHEEVVRLAAGLQEIPKLPLENPDAKEPEKVSETEAVLSKLAFYAFDYPAIDTSNWQTIANTELNISFKIPKDWAIEGCGDGFEGLKPCKEGRADLSLGRKRELRKNGEDFQFFLYLADEPVALTRRAIGIIDGLKNEEVNKEFLQRGVMKREVYRTIVGGQEAILYFQERPDYDLQIFKAYLNDVIGSISIMGSDGSPAEIAPHGAFKAFIDSIQFAD
ncbi:MAG: hypothetical protein KIH65_004415 [Candidatus Uhrbacteria bacterium]|nr:hypothetical protein [Candidatus Uhrbacteria bacterium]